MNSFLEPFKNSLIIKILIAIFLFLFSLVTNAQVDKNAGLYKTLKTKDSILFQRGFNKCELEKLEPIIAKDIEFYHDVAGVQDRKGFMDALKNNVCSNPGMNKRKLVENSLSVFQMKENNKLYGAIQKGKHIFQQKIDGKMKTVGIANFTHLWVLENNKWKLKRVLSYNHKPYSE
ncbi:MAG: nuclear transport factor 2 family protein [Polaribacter sp.]|uniref:nuclear transport factor 2 family protein n=1 Tax=Polaribacter sp. TaxID=1920175 RepID=UPI002F35DDDD